MKKTYILEDLDCAHCASLIEEKVAKLPGVMTCTVNFLSTKMTLEMEDDKIDCTLKEAKKIIKKLEPDVSVVEV